jgi:hypothetical protein
MNLLLGHWSAVAAGRISEPRPRDLFAIVAASEPTERVAFLNLQLLQFD